MWLVRGYEPARAVLTDARFSRARAVLPQAPKVNDAEPVPASMMSMDGSEDARLRRIISGAFTTGRVTAMAPGIERLVDWHLDAIAAAGPGADVMELLAKPLPLAVLCTLLGVPHEDSQQFGNWVVVLFDISAGTPRERIRHRVQLARYMARLIDRKRRESGDDLLTALIGRHDDGDLSMTELVTMGLSLLMAGYETTIGQIGLSVLLLLSDPSRRGDVAERPTQAVEDLLRLSPSAPLRFPRVATEDIRLGDVVIRSGEGVLVSLLDANRDPAAFRGAGRSGSAPCRPSHLRARPTPLPGCSAGAVAGADGSGAPAPSFPDATPGD
jgi:nocardicin N-oxygenase